MKEINALGQRGSSSRGRGRGRGGGRGAASQPEKQQGGRGARRDDQEAPRARPRDGRFTRRHSDPTFQRFKGVADDYHGADGSNDKLDRRVRRPGITSRGAPAAYRGGAADYDDDEDEFVARDDIDNIPEDEAAALDEDAAQWSGSEASYTEATRRLAVVRCDWDHVRASDLLAILLGSLPLGGSIKGVTVYLSDFGKERIEYERAHGPDLWERKGAPSADDDDAASKAPAKASSAKGRLAAKLGLEEEEDAEEALDDAADASSDDAAVLGDEGLDGGEGDVDGDGERFSSGKYRQYEMDRMRYYYGIIEFDSPATAAHVYRECDGLAIENSGVALDLRYVDDADEFDKSRVRDHCSKLPSNFKPLKAFLNQAVSNTKFKISWDRDDPIRTQSLRDVFTGETQDTDMMAYLASETDDDDEGEGDAAAAAQTSDANAAKKRRRELQRRKIRSRYAALLESIGSKADELPDEGGLFDGLDLPAAAKAEAPEEGDEQVAAGEEAASVSGGDAETGEDDDDDSDNDSDLIDSDAWEGASIDEEEGDGGDAVPSGDMEATFHMDAADRASALQRDIGKRRKLAGASVGEVVQAKYKERRREGKKEKKEALRRAEELEREHDVEQADTQRAKLIKTFEGRIEPASERGVKRSKVEKKKARQAREAAKREEAMTLAKARKEARARERLGGGRASSSAPVGKPRTDVPSEKTTSAAAATAPAATGGALDSRLRDRLLHDPRFHIDVSADSHRKKPELAALATTVAKTRATKASTTSTAAGPSAGAASGDFADVSFFQTRSGIGRKRPRPAE